MIPETTIDQVKDRMEIADVVGAFVTLKRHGGNLVGLCPFHNEKSPSFTVSAAKKIYKCFGCGRSGDCITFLVDHQKLSYLDSIKWLADRYHITVEEEVKKEIVRPLPRLEKLSEKALKWFEQERGITNNTLLRFGITEAIEFMPGIDKETTVMCFNYFRDEELVNIKFRGPKKSFKMAKDAELIFYNLDAIKGETECVIVEGEVDCLSLYEAGIYNAVSVPNGASKGKQRLEYFDNCFQYFTDKTRVILFTDNDDPGNSLKNELSRRIGRGKCYQVKCPAGCKDANDVLRNHGKEVLKQLVENATRLPIEGEILVSDVRAEVDDYYENGYPPGAKAKIPGFDELLTFGPGLLTTVTGVPGSGKDEFINYVATSLSRFNDWTWGVWPMEEPVSVTVTKLAEKFAQKSFAFRSNPDHRMNQREYDRALSMVERYFHFVNVNKVDITINGVIEKAKELVERYGINGMIISPWNCLEHKLSNGLSETLYVSEKLTELIQFLSYYGVHCFLLAHPRKVDKNKQTGKYNVPTLYDISGSANFYNKTHNGLCVYRDFDTSEVSIFVQKVKFHWHGRQGMCQFHFNKQTRQYDIVGSDIPGTVQVELGEGSWKPFKEN